MGYLVLRQPGKRHFVAFRRTARDDGDVKSLCTPMLYSFDRLRNRRHAQQFLRSMHDAIQLVAFAGR